MTLNKKEKLFFKNKNYKEVLVIIKEKIESRFLNKILPIMLNPDPEERIDFKSLFIYINEFLLKETTKIKIYDFLNCKHCIKNMYIINNEQSIVKDVEFAINKEKFNSLLS